MNTRTTPCIIHQQADADYRRLDGLSQSMAKELLNSPAHYMARYGPEAQPFFPTAAMKQGTAVHCRVLEPEVFAQAYMSKDDKPKEPTVAELKVQLDAAGIEYPKSAKKGDLEALLWPDGKPAEKREALTGDIWREVHGAADALRTHDITGHWFDPGQQDYRKMNEVSCMRESDLGQLLKGRFDRIQIEDGVVKVLDLKTTADASPRQFQRTAANLHYDLQAAWYTLLAEGAFPGLPVEFYFVAVERKAPHGISLFKASAGLINSGRRKMAKALALHAQCLELDYWPSYDPVIHELELPTWAEQQEEPASSEF